MVGFLLCIANILHFFAKSKCGLSHFNICHAPLRVAPHKQVPVRNGAGFGRRRHVGAKNGAGFGKRRHVGAKNGAGVGRHRHAGKKTKVATTLLSQPPGLLGLLGLSADGPICYPYRARQGHRRRFGAHSACRRWCYPKGWCSYPAGRGKCCRFRPRCG